MFLKECTVQCTLRVGIPFTLLMLVSSDPTAVVDPTSGVLARLFHTLMVLMQGLLVIFAQLVDAPQTVSRAVAVEGGELVLVKELLK